MTGSISFYTKYLNMAMPEFNINTWHDFMYDAFKVLDASIGNLYSVENFKGSWKNSTIYYVGDKLINSEDFLVYEVLIEHTTDGTSTVSDFIANNPTYYEAYDPITLSRAWAIKETLVNNEDYSSKMYAVGTIEQNPNGSSKYYMEKTNSLKVDVQGLKNSVDSTKLLIDNIYTNVTSLKNETLGYKNESKTFATNSKNSSVNSENSSINSNTYATNSLNYMNQTLIYRNEAEVFRNRAEQATSGKANTNLDNLSTAGQARFTVKADKTYVDTQDNLKANTNASNFTATGKETVVGWGMPGFFCKPRVILVSGVWNYADKNIFVTGICQQNLQGYIYINKIASDAGQAVASCNVSPGTGGWSCSQCFIRKGIYYKVIYNNIGYYDELMEG